MRSIANKQLAKEDLAYWRACRGLLSPVAYAERPYTFNTMLSFTSTLSEFCKMNGSADVMRHPTLGGPFGQIPALRRAFVDKRAHAANAITVQVSFVLCIEM
jgi:hypothetical protein